MNLFCFSLEGSTDSLYEAVKSCGEDPPRPVPSRSCSRSCSRSSALLLDNNTKSRGSRRSISMEMPQTQRNNSSKKKRRTHLSKSASDNEALDNSCCNHTGLQGAASRADFVYSSGQTGEPRKSKPRADSKRGRGFHPSSTKKKEKPPSTQCANVKGSTAESKPAAKRIQKSGNKHAEKNGKEGSRKSHKSTVKTVNSPCPPLSPSLEPNFLEVPHRSEVRFSTLPTQEHTASSRSVDSVHLPGGATPTHTYHQRWSNLGEGSPSWGTVQHTCRRPLTEYHLYSQDFSTSTPGHRDQVHQTCTVTRSITEVDLSEPNVSPNATLIQFML
ncbi:uncharacterized protein LOC112486967 isoform X2 [Cynoglossus semilaevis]|uniref:uncharacterized protein LOC112486967 isoform X2 n=1 Tax=Cynoglossus semilaevis TaxID=244447 RepID=UPI000D6234DD|nr:uncharacterized protein LOC112486967 isoform X2 [Cynoglossus semilaevis]